MTALAVRTAFAPVVTVRRGWAAMTHSPREVCKKKAAAWSPALQSSAVPAEETLLPLAKSVALAQLVLTTRKFCTCGAPALSFGALRHWELKTSALAVSVTSQRSERFASVLRALRSHSISVFALMGSV